MELRAQSGTAYEAACTVRHCIWSCVHSAALNMKLRAQCGTAYEATCTHQWHLALLPRVYNGRSLQLTTYLYLTAGLN